MASRQAHSHLQHIVGVVKGLANLFGLHLHPANADQRSGMLEAQIDLAFTPMPLEVVGEGASAVDALKLSKSLASEEQVVETGSVFAGAGSGTTLRVAEKLAQDYGGQAGDWAKMSSTARDYSDGTHIETPWYENVVTGEQVKYVTIIHPEVKP